MAAGLQEASTVLLTTNDDATNIYLAVYCRRLRPDLRIVSRVNHRRNLEAIHRAGADFVLSYDELGVDAVMSILHGQELVILGEGIDLFSVPVPASLANQTLAQTGIGSRTGLSVVAVEQDGRVANVLSSDMVLKPGAELTVRATDANGTVKEFTAIVRIDTPEELVPFRHGGILPYVLRQLSR